MDMILQEIEVWYAIPAIRREFALEMLKNGIKKAEIAKKLGITKAAVSQYLTKKRAQEMKFNKALKREIKKSVKRIIEGENPLKEIQKIISILRKKNFICKFHMSKEKIEKKCRICFKNE